MEVVILIPIFSNLVSFISFFVARNNQGTSNKMNETDYEHYFRHHVAFPRSKMTVILFVTEIMIMKVIVNCVNLAIFASIWWSLLVSVRYAEDHQMKEVEVRRIRDIEAKIRK